MVVVFCCTYGLNSATTKVIQNLIWVSWCETQEKAGVKKLLLGHFSSMYELLDDFKTEACSVFENTELGN